VETLLEEIRRGERRSLARAMSLVDQGTSGAHTVVPSHTTPRAADFSPRGAAQAEACGSSQRAPLDALKDRLRQLTGQIPWWGFTGPPGVGKSTLIDALLTALRTRNRRIGVVAVDPTSPMSDGALLGDRVRMMRHAVDPNVFIRSLATHHYEGGLSDAALHCARLLELAGYDHVLIETVGVGQSEADIATVADICVVMLGPGYGDDIQLIKAGLLEIAHIVVVNKCDQPEANRLLKDVYEESGHSSSAGDVEIIALEAKSGKGVDQLLEKLLALDNTARGAEQRRRHRHRQLLAEIKRSALLTYEQALNRQLASPAGEKLITRLERGEVSLEEVIGDLSAIGTL
jgi:LAO/AO transport system kinase